MIGGKQTKERHAAPEPLPFARLMGIDVVSVTPELVIGELKVRQELCTRPDILHGGAYMAFADTIGAIATVANLKEGESTTTIESKTNFFAAVPLDDTARAEARRSIAAAPRWSGKRGSRVATAAFARS